MESYRKVITIKAPSSKVFDALTTQEGLSGWWTTDTLQDGELITFRFDDTYCVMRVVTLQPNKEVLWKCTDQYFKIDGSTKTDEWVGTTISFLLSEHPNNATMISFEHMGLNPQLACYGECSAGWTHFLQSLRNYLEVGRGSPYTSNKGLDA